MKRAQSSSPSEPPSALHLLHVGSMDARLIGLSIERHWTRSVRLVETLEEAQVVLIDCDRPGIEAVLDQLAGHPRIGIVYYAFHPKDHAPRFQPRPVLGKPLNLESLPVTLARARADAAHVIAAAPPRPIAPPPAPSAPAAASAPAPLGNSLMADDERDLCGGMDDIPAAPGSPLPDKLFFNPDDYLIGRLQQALALASASGRPHLISGLPRLIGIEPRPIPVCITAFRENQLRPLAMTQLPESTGRIVSTPLIGEADSQPLQLAAEDFLWNAAAWAARGRLPAGSNPYRPVRLRAWPNFTYAFASPHAMRIAALWTRTQASPVEIAARLGIPHRYVFSVYSAASFAGLLDTTTGDANTPAALPAPPAQTDRPARPSILSRILRKLRDAV
ncbi:hypothetical protein [Zoogloea sp.]|uniref:hypothetical protein n=1 Tax=Zoogloea sp. TaxID=49181 RepID=UPI0025D0134B|nr:hypothetical protein [Zoogloea sp.]MCK6392339.1 hypothetical protein [Zoogloea sp.]